MTRRTLHRSDRIGGAAELPSGGVMLPGAGSSAAAAITNPAELARRLQELTGCEGYRIVGNVAICLRWDLDGNEIVIDRIELCGVSA